MGTRRARAAAAGRGQFARVWLGRAEVWRGCGASGAGGTVDKISHPTARENYFHGRLPLEAASEKIFNLSFSIYICDYLLLVSIKSSTPLSEVPFAVLAFTAPSRWCSALSAMALTPRSWSTARRGNMIFFLSFSCHSSHPSQRRSWEAR